VTAGGVDIAPQGVTQLDIISGAGLIISGTSSTNTAASVEAMIISISSAGFILKEFSVDSQVG